VQGLRRRAGGLARHQVGVIIIITTTIIIIIIIITIIIMDVGFIPRLP
jgi:hypothetical protein